MNLPNDAKLTPQQIEELGNKPARCLDAIASWSSERGTTGSITKLLTTDPRFRFLDQVPNARRAILQAARALEVNAQFDLLWETSDVTSTPKKTSSTPYSPYQQCLGILNKLISGHRFWWLPFLTRRQEKFLSLSFDPGDWLSFPRRLAKPRLTTTTHDKIIIDFEEEDDGDFYRATFVPEDQEWKLSGLKFQCPSCFGTGKDFPLQLHECDLCGGTGWGVAAASQDV